MKSPETPSEVLEPPIDDELPPLSSVGYNPDALGKLERDAAKILRQRRQERAEKELNG